MGRWSRKRKAKEKEEKASKLRCQQDEGCKKKNGDGYYTPIRQINEAMEAYYAYQGLHDIRREYGGTCDTEEECTSSSSSHALPSFVLCATDDEKSEEKSRFYSTVRDILPASFRIGVDCSEEFRNTFVQEVDEHAGQAMEIEVEVSNSTTSSSSNLLEKSDGDVRSTGEKSTVKRKVAPARRISFIPHAYQLSVDRRTIRRNPALQEFHDWLKVQTSAGFITRQETVSMIPPVVLDVQPGHYVLDMCAAPGSKTSQMLEIVSAVRPGEREPRGFVVANDRDPKRAYMLVHQLRRINSPAIFVTSCDAQFFPQIRLPGLSKKEAVGEGIFDRVLCDVPCSGDGTMRKNPGIWKHWTQLGALALHPMQIAITVTGARLAKVGGFICYSTCSLNPTENEAVVAEILRLTNGALELVDRRTELVGLVARSGWSSWKVLRGTKKQSNKGKNSPKMIQKRKEWAEKLSEEISIGNKVASGAAVAEHNGEEVKADATAVDQDENVADSIEEGLNCARWDSEFLRSAAEKHGLIVYDTVDDVPEPWKKRVRASCFPPSEDEKAKFHLDRCMRCLPHDMDTGGFFVALFKKTAPIGATAQEKAIEMTTELTGETECTKRACNADATRKIDGGGRDLPLANSQQMDAKELIVTSPRVLGSFDGADAVREKSSVNTGSTPDAVPGPRPKGKKRGDLGNSDFVGVDESIWPDLVEFYGLCPKFPKGQFMSREHGTAKVLYFITRAVKELLIDNGIQRTTVINSGLKAFVRNNKDCDVKYRISQEAIHFTAPYMTKRKFLVNFKDFSICLDSGTIRLSQFSQTFSATIKSLSPGSFVVVLQGFEDDIVRKMLMVMWRCRGDAVNCLVTKEEMNGIASKLRALGKHKEDTPEGKMNIGYHDQQGKGEKV